MDTTKPLEQNIVDIFVDKNIIKVIDEIYDYLEGEKFDEIDLSDIIEDVVIANEEFQKTVGILGIEYLKFNIKQVIERMIFIMCYPDESKEKHITTDILKNYYEHKKELMDKILENLEELK